MVSTVPTWVELTGLVENDSHITFILDNYLLFSNARSLSLRRESVSRFEIIATSGISLVLQTAI